MSTRGQKETFLFSFLFFFSPVVNPGHALLREAAERERERVTRGGLDRFGHFFFLTTI